MLPPDALTASERKALFCLKQAHDTAFRLRTDPWQFALELAELLGLPVAGMNLGLGAWSRPFPTQHPLYVGALLRDMRYPGKPDLLLNLGHRFGERAGPGTKLISMRSDPASIARNAPVDLGPYAWMELPSQTRADYLVTALHMATSQYPWLLGATVFNLDYAASPAAPTSERPWFSLLNPDRTPRPAFIKFQQARTSGYLA